MKINYEFTDGIMAILGCGKIIHLAVQLYILPGIPGHL